eukprot:TRINITY_DN13783_c0_g1_i1.p1 TRINITY_DN13783_c0_g1~~TRINITY_DN13783_c0_g1_i1.p1  ORF type:complete len:1237 (+),score=280.43 TRINITY_DN13783_c0_g1_i1:374-3712(+)
MGGFYSRPISEDEENEGRARRAHDLAEEYSGKDAHSTSGGTQSGKETPSDNTSFDFSESFEVKSLRPPSSARRGDEESSMVEGEGAPPLRVHKEPTLYDSERWEAQLIPCEPDPLLYDSYEDYLRAMLSWTEVVMESIYYIPPNGKQLATVLPLSIPMESDVSFNLGWMPRINRLNLSKDAISPIIRFSSFLSAFNTKIVPNLEFEYSIKIATPIDSELSISFDKLLQKWLNHQGRAALKQAKGVVYVRDAYGDTRLYCIPAPNTFFAYQESDNSKYYLRRTAMAISTVKDEPAPKVGDKARTVPTFELAETRFSTEEEKLKGMAEFLNLQHKYRNHFLYTWWNIDKIKDADKQKSKVNQTIESDKISKDDIINLFLSPINPDVFYDSIEPEGSLKTSTMKGIGVILKKIDKSLYRSIFGLIKDSNDRKLHARMAVFLLSALNQSGYAQAILSYWLDLGLGELQFLPYLIHYFGPTERDIFPYSVEDISLYQQALLSQMVTKTEVPTSTESSTNTKELQTFFDKYWNKFSESLKEKLENGVHSVIVSIIGAAKDMKCAITTNLTPELSTEIPSEVYTDFCSNPFRTSIINKWRESGFEVTTVLEPKTNTDFAYKFRLAPKTNTASLSETKKDVELILNYFLKWYYCNESRIGLKPTKYVDANTILSKESKTLGKDLLQLIKKDQRYLPTIIKNISHKSQRISHFFLFFVIQMIKGNDLMSIIMDPQINLYSHIRNFFYSKYSHVKFAGKQLLQCVIDCHEEDFKRYLKHKNNFLCILQENSQFSTLVTKLIISDLQKWWKEGKKSPLESNSKIGTNYTSETLSNASWVDSSIINELILKYLKPSPSALLYAQILYQMVKLLSKEDTETSKKKHEKIDIKIDKEHINMVVNYLKSSCETENMDISLTCHLMGIVRQFSKMSDYFVIINHSQLNAMVSVFLNHTNNQLNKESWKLLYHIMKYNSGVIESWIEDQKSLKNFFFPFTVGSNISTIENAFRYITKLLTLPPRVKKGKSDKKSVESDLKLLVNYWITKNISMHLHMIYLSLKKKYPGGSYHGAMKFFHSMTKDPNLSKLYKEYIKNPQWKEDVDEVTLKIQGSKDEKSKKARERTIWF